MCLDGANGYRPTRFADVTLDGRANTGAGLGNIAFDRWHDQFFVPDWDVRAWLFELMPLAYR